VTLSTPVPARGEKFTTVADFVVGKGQRVPFVLIWHPSHEPVPAAPDAESVASETAAWWHEWTSRCDIDGEWREAVVRSLITLKALTYAPTGGIVAAPTTSLPEDVGGVRNWDYRFCWLRDATFTLQVLVKTGYSDEACHWREWLLRAIAGAPGRLQILYGVAGERRVPEQVLPWLPGYEASSPVRIGNAAVDQHQLDVYGEVMDTLWLARSYGLDPDENAWRLQQGLMDWLEGGWREPDEGLWEVRGRREHFVHSKVLAWVAADRAVRTIDQHGLPGPRERYARLAEDIHADVCAKGYDADRQTFTQFYGSRGLDAALLLIPQMGFLPPTDERVRGTLRAVRQELAVDGLLRRYDTGEAVDGLPGDEGAFLACTFWLVDALVLDGQEQEARVLFERLLTLTNDVGLLAEEYDVTAGRQLGNFPQAYSHLALVNSALHLHDAQVASPARAAQPRATGSAED
jgi:GH15 family glucan-1,4-alpha-glucosidase